MSDQSPLPNIRVPKDTPVAIVMSTGPPGGVDASTAILTATVGQPYSDQATATDANAGDTLTFALATAPAGMSINPVASGAIGWMLTDTQVGNHAVTVRVADPLGLFAEQSFVVAVVRSAGACLLPPQRGMELELSRVFGGAGIRPPIARVIAGNNVIVAGVNGSNALVRAVNSMSLESMWSTSMPGPAAFRDVAITASHPT